MRFESINPADGTTIEVYEAMNHADLSAVVGAVHDAWPAWRDTPLDERAALLRNAADVLRERRDALALLMTREMGKLNVEARAEIDKCAWVCEYYADHAEGMLADEVIDTDAGRSYVAWQPLGPVLAVMPWNFPFWQVFRFAAPNLVAGNVGLLKHASNVPGCALALEAVFRDAGFPEHVFRTLMIPASMVADVIADERVRAVTLTGSEPAGRSVAETAGRHLKPVVLELGGSDPFIVLDDADLDLTVEQAVVSRFLNCGQSCIAAKRFIVVDAIADTFVERFRDALDALVPGDPLHDDTRLGPMARHDLRDQLHRQVLDSIQAGAVAVTGCVPESGAGAYYPASILDRVQPGMPAWSEELFGPVASIIRVRDEEEAIEVANGSRFGLGGSVWTRDTARGERLALRLACGSAFVNGMVKSDPRLPFGGIKDSGHGRELSELGLKAFLNAKTVWVR